MYHLLPLRQIFKILASLNVFVVVYLVSLFNPVPSSSFEIFLKYISIGISILDFTFFVIISTYLWRWLWQVFPFLSSISFPDINGIWEGKIIFQGVPEQDISLKAKARIRQTFWSIHIDLYSTTSKSNTLVAYPTVEAGNQRVYYVYHNTPQNPDYPEFKGTSILEVKSKSIPMQLIGHYFTIRGTRGRVELKRTSNNPNDDLDIA